MSPDFCKETSKTGGENIKKMLNIMEFLSLNDLVQKLLIAQLGLLLPPVLSSLLETPPKPKENTNFTLIIFKFQKLYSNKD